MVSERPYRCLLSRISVQQQPGEHQRGSSCSTLYSLLQIFSGYRNGRQPVAFGFGCQLGMWVMATLSNKLCY